MSYSNEENLVIQSTCNAVLLSSLSMKYKEFIKVTFSRHWILSFLKLKKCMNRGKQVSVIKVCY